MVAHPWVRPARPVAAASCHQPVDLASSAVGIRGSGDDPARQSSRRRLVGPRITRACGSGSANCPLVRPRPSPWSTATTCRWSTQRRSCAARWARSRHTSAAVARHSHSCWRNHNDERSRTTSPRRCQCTGRSAGCRGRAGAHVGHTWAAAAHAAADTRRRRTRGGRRRRRVRDRPRHQQADLAVELRRRRSVAVDDPCGCRRRRHGGGGDLVDVAGHDTDDGAGDRLAAR